MNFLMSVRVISSLSCNALIRVLSTSLASGILNLESLLIKLTVSADFSTLSQSLRTALRIREDSSYCLFRSAKVIDHVNLLATVRSILAFSGSSSSMTSAILLSLTSIVSLRCSLYISVIEGICIALFKAFSRSMNCLSFSASTKN